MNLYTIISRCSPSRGGIERSEERSKKVFELTTITQVKNVKKE